MLTVRLDEAATVQIGRNVGANGKMPSAYDLQALKRFYRRKSASFVFRKPLLVSPNRPLISFTFDDFPKSALFVGGEILREFGATGTFYASLGLAGQDTVSGRIFSLDDLKEVVARGHELACHTYSHCDSWDTAPATFKDSTLQNTAALRTVLPDLKFENFSYPISMPRPLTKAKVAPLFLSCRGGGQTTNVGKSDLNQLSAFFLEKSRDNFQAVMDLIDFNRSENGWLIFATHDVAENHTPYGCSPGFFKRVVEYAHGSGAQIVPVVDALEILSAPGCERNRPGPRSKLERIAISSSTQNGFGESLQFAASANPEASQIQQADIHPSGSPKPLVSILIPAYNSEEWIADTIKSALAQTWEPKEIIVVDDGSKDRTYAFAKQFESDSVRVVAQKNQGSAACRNTAFSLSKGQYIQWLDADDLLSPNKVASQMAMLEKGITSRTLLSAGFGKFLYRYERAEFSPTALWEDLCPKEWLLRKLGQNLYMQTATWLTSRELCEAAGQWNTNLSFDDDGEYYCRVLLACDGVRFVPGGKVYYRSPGTAFGNTVSYIGDSTRKLEAQWESTKLHIQYLLSMEDSQRARAACITFLQDSFGCFYPEMPEIMKQMEQLAADLGGGLKTPKLPWKYSWIKSLFGWHTAKRAQARLLRLKWILKKTIDKALFHPR